MQSINVGVLFRLFYYVSKGVSDYFKCYVLSRAKILAISCLVKHIHNFTSDFLIYFRTILNNYFLLLEKVYSDNEIYWRSGTLAISEYHNCYHISMH
jgi:hypothetical protein